MSSSTHSFTPLQWRPQLAIGHEAIDQDHRHLIDLINQVQLCFVEEKTIGSLTLALEALHEYTRRHFAREEAVMKKCAFPALAHHAASHRELMQRLDELTEKLLLAHQRSATANSLPKSEREALLQLLRDWLVQHVIQEDLRLRDHLAVSGQRETSP